MTWVAEQAGHPTSTSSAKGRTVRAAYPAPHVSNTLMDLARSDRANQRQRQSEYMQQATYQAATSRQFNTVSISDINRPAAPFQVPSNLSADEIRELVRDILG